MAHKSQAVSKEMTMTDVSAGFGYEEGCLAPKARALAWSVVAFLCCGVFGAALLDNAAIMNWSLRISFVVTIVGYIYFCRVSLRGRATPVVAFLPRGAWSVIILAVCLNVVNLMYAVLNAPLFGTHSVESHWDSLIPTVPAFVIPYLGFYVVVFGTETCFAFSLLHRHLRSFLLALLLAMLTAQVTFVLFQTYVPTGPLGQDSYSDGILGSMLRFTNEGWYEGRWYSAFPSMHCGYSTILAIAWIRRRKPAWSVIALAYSASVVAATLFLHEHYLMDALYGIVVGIAAYASAWYLSEYHPATRGHVAHDADRRGRQR
jgi:hypothetical protein